MDNIPFQSIGCWHGVARGCNNILCQGIGTSGHLALNEPCRQLVTPVNVLGNA